MSIEGHFIIRITTFSIFEVFPQGRRGLGDEEREREREKEIAVCMPPHNQARKTDPTCPSKNISADVEKFTGFNFPETYAFARALVIKLLHGPRPLPPCHAGTPSTSKIEIYAKRT